MQNLFLSDQNMPPRKPDGFLQDVQDSDDIASLTLHLKQEVRTPEGRMLHRWRLKATHASFLFLALRKESPRMRATGFSQE